MKKIIPHLCKVSVSCILSLSLVSCILQKKTKNNILLSNSIPDIQAFLKNAHPDDPKRIILKRKLIALKNKAWTEGSKYAHPMPARPIENNTAMFSYYNKDEEKEYFSLMSETSEKHKKKTLELLNSLFSEDEVSQEKILLVKNNTKCNMIMRIKNGTSPDFQKLPIPANGENFITLRKGSYFFDANICGFSYHSTKELYRNLLVELKQKQNY